MPAERRPLRPARLLTKGNKLFGRYKGVPRCATLAHFSDRHTKVPYAYSILTSVDPYTLTHYAAGGTEALFTSSLLFEGRWPQMTDRVLHTFSGEISVVMNHITTRRDMWIDRSYYVLVPASITPILQPFAFTIGHALLQLKFPPIYN